MTRTDLVVVGGGATGASLALAARGLSVCLVAHSRPRPGASPPSGYDQRVYALSPGSVAFLRSIKVWDSIPPERLTPVHAMRVHGDAASASLTFDAYRAGVPELAWIVEDRALQAALWHALASREGLEILAPARASALQLGAHACITLEGGRQLTSDLVVGADGADSFVRGAASIGQAETDYGQSAVVTNFSSARPHGNTAMQWFQGGAVLALLPLPGNRVSMVWSVATERAARLMALDPASLAGEVRSASGAAFGDLEVIAPPLAFPLRRLTAAQMVLPHLALAGDAAHVIHPLAGQGLNLGLQDACVLGRLLAGRDPVRKPGDIGLLRRYERERREAILAMRVAVHGLYSLFGAHSDSLRRLRNIGLNFTDRATVIKGSLLRHALR